MDECGRTIHIEVDRYLQIFRNGPGLNIAPPPTPLLTDRIGLGVWWLSANGLSCIFLDKSWDDSQRLVCAFNLSQSCRNVPSALRDLLRVDFLARMFMQSRTKKPDRQTFQVDSCRQVTQLGNLTVVFAKWRRMRRRRRRPTYRTFLMLQLDNCNPRAALEDEELAPHSVYPKSG